MQQYSQIKNTLFSVEPAFWATSSTVVCCYPPLCSFYCTVPVLLQHCNLLSSMIELSSGQGLNALEQSSAGCKVSPWRGRRGSIACIQGYLFIIINGAARQHIHRQCQCPPFQKLKDWPTVSCMQPPQVLYLIRYTSTPVLVDLLLVV